MKNSELLEMYRRTPSRLISSLDKQRGHILNLHSAKLPCPNCGTPQNVFEAAGVSIDDYTTDTYMKADYTCIEPRCGRKLVHTVPLIAIGAGWHWTLVPIDVTQDHAAGG